VQTLLKFSDEGRADGSFDAGIEHALQRVLISPDFLFRIERARSGKGADIVVSNQRFRAGVAACRFLGEQHPGR
jgi:hypothetical protein